VDIYGRIRRAVLVDGRSQRAVAREFGISRDSVRKMLRFSVPPGYQRQQPIKRPKLDPLLCVINTILAEDKARPAKQRHTAKRIFERLKEEHGGDLEPENISSCLRRYRGSPDRNQTFSGTDPACRPEPQLISDIGRLELPHDSSSRYQRCATNANILRDEVHGQCGR